MSISSDFLFILYSTEANVQLSRCHCHNMDKWWRIFCEWKL